MPPHSRTHAAPSGLPWLLLGGLLGLWLALFLSLGSDLCAGRPWSPPTFVGRTLR